MFYTNRVLFVHVPRTGGTWLTRWALEHLPAGAVSVDVHYHKHDSHQALLHRTPELRGLAAFTISRDEDERRVSYYRHARYFVPLNPPTHLPSWDEITESGRTLDFEGFCQKWFLASGCYVTPAVRWFPFERDLKTLTQWLLEMHSR